MLDITLEQLRIFSDHAGALVTVDAPLFGVVMIMNGRVLIRGSHETDKIGKSIGFPPREQIVAEASRFWILRNDGVRERKTREEMVTLLRETQRAAGATS